MFSSRSSTVSGLVFKSLIHFELIFCEWCKEFSFIRISSFPNPFIEETILSLPSIFGFLVKY